MSSSDRDAAVGTARSPEIIDLRDGATVVPHVGELPAWPSGVHRSVDADETEVGAGVSGARVAHAIGATVEIVAAAPDTRIPVIVSQWLHTSGPVWEPEPEARWRTPQMLLAALAALLIGLGLGFVLGHRRGDTSAAVRQRTRAASGSVAASSTARSPAAAPTVAPTSSLRFGSPASAVAPPTGPGTYREPLPIGASATLRDVERGDLTISVLAVDADPWDRITKENAFNTNAPLGLRYVMVTVTVGFRAGTKQATFDGVASALAFSAFGSAAREHRDAEYPVITPGGMDRSADLLDGGTITGNLVFAVEYDSVGTSLRVQRTLCSGACSEVWIALT